MSMSMSMSMSMFVVIVAITGGASQLTRNAAPT